MGYDPKASLTPAHLASEVPAACDLPQPLLTKTEAIRRIVAEFRIPPGAGTQVVFVDSIGAFHRQGAEADKATARMPDVIIDEAWLTADGVRHFLDIKTLEVQKKPKPAAAAPKNRPWYGVHRGHKAQRY